jgi:hypothetical protein
MEQQHPVQLDDKPPSSNSHFSPQQAFGNEPHRHLTFLLLLLEGLEAYDLQKGGPRSYGQATPALPAA